MNDVCDQRVPRHATLALRGNGINDTAVFVLSQDKAPLFHVVQAAAAAR
jgi:hypothetical protein